MTMARALATSNNIVAVKVLNEIGPSEVIDMAHRMGLKAELENNLSLTLGSSGATLLDMTSAFGVLDNNGVRAEPYVIDKIVDAQGRTVYEHQARKTNVLDRTTTDTMISMLQGVIQFGTGHAADIGRPAAGKTGTSDDHRDAWFIGFTPEMVTGVWVGNDDNTPMQVGQGKGLTGGALPAEIWRNYMRGVLADRLINNFDLAYSKPLDRADFFNYKVENLSKSERYNPAAANADTEPPQEQPDQVADPLALSPEDTIPPEEDPNPSPQRAVDLAPDGLQQTVVPPVQPVQPMVTQNSTSGRRSNREPQPLNPYPTSTPGNVAPPDSIQLRPSRRSQPIPDYAGETPE